MDISNLKFPGARTQKTALAVFICIVVLHLIGFDSPFYACIAAVICMQDSFENTVKMGKNRMIGTIIGGIAGVLATSIFFMYNNYYFNAIVITILAMTVIHICHLLKKPGAVSIACIVLLANTVLIKQEPSYIYTITRVIETFLGIIITTIINRYIFPYKKTEPK